MKTYKVVMKNYTTETVMGASIAVDDQGNLLIGDSVFNDTEWSHAVFLYDNSLSGQPSPTYYDPYLDAPQQVSPNSAFLNEVQNW